MNALKSNLYAEGIAILSQSITGLAPAKMEVVKEPIKAKKCFWDVTENYCKKAVSKSARGYGDTISQPKLNIVRKLETVGTMQRQQLTVTINGIESVYTLGKKNEYFLNGVSLTKTLEALAAGTGNKIQIR